MPVNSFECIKLSNGTYLLKIYTLSMVTVGNLSVQEGRVLTDVRAYANQNLMVTDLRLLIG